MTDSQPITELLSAVRRGDPNAMDRLFAIVYENLRHIAHRQLSGQQGRTLDTTTLVHETYLKLVDRSRCSPNDRRHFFAIASRAMRQIIVDHARTAHAAKRGGKAERVSTGGLANENLTGKWDDILGVDRALSRLSEVNDRLGRVVELRFFAGLSTDEVAELLEVSPRTVKRDWQAARAFLYRELSEVKGV
jgi:RNA polymerase sigma factor (TIGR02999 family)